jgi:hypothetical protein
MEKLKENFRNGNILMLMFFVVALYAFAHFYNRLDGHLMSFVQVMIFIFGASGIWFVSRKEEWKRWGYIFGLMGQPFWFYTALVNQQWGILALTVFILIRGVREFIIIG